MISSLICADDAKSKGVLAFKSVMAVLAPF